MTRFLLNLDIAFEELKSQEKSCSHLEKFQLEFPLNESMTIAEKIAADIVCANTIFELKSAGVFLKVGTLFVIIFYGIRSANAVEKVSDGKL